MQGYGKMERELFNYNCSLPFLRLQVHAVKLASLDEVLDEVNRNTSTSLNDLRNELPQSVVSQLRYEEVIKIFRLKKDRRPIFDVQDEELISIPKHLDYDLMDIQDFITEDPTNETYSRLRLDSILRACVRDERASLASQPDESSKTNSNKPIATLQSDLSIVVKRRRRLELLNSSVDYSIWHDDKSTLGISLVVVRVRNKAAFDAGLKECLAYSAMIQNIRKKNFGRNATVSGVVSDSFDFTFLRVDNGGRWNTWSSPEPWSERTASRIYTLLRLIIRNGPNTSMPCSTERSKWKNRSEKPIKYRMGFGSSSEHPIGF